MSFHNKTCIRSAMESVIGVRIFRTNGKVGDQLNPNFTSGSGWIVWNKQLSLWIKLIASHCSWFRYLTVEACTRQGPSSQLLMLRRVPWPPESGCRKCRGPKKCLLNLKLPMSSFRSRPVYLKTSLTRNSFTQITGTPSKPELKARGAVTNLWATKVQTFPVLCEKYKAIVNSFI